MRIHALVRTRPRRGSTALVSLGSISITESSKRVANGRLRPDHGAKASTARPEVATVDVVLRSLHPAWLCGCLLVAACDPNDDSVPQPEPWPGAVACEGLDDDDWDPERIQREDDAIERIARLREEGADCGEAGKSVPAPRLRRRTALDCAARFHARDMAEREYVGRLDPDGVDEWARVADTGYSASALVQHVAAGPRDVDELVDQTWLPRPVPCSNLTSDELTEIGIGYFGITDDDFGTYWVVLLASPGTPPES